MVDLSRVCAAGTGVKASLLGTKKLSDGKTYPTYNGWLMYEYAGDPGPGQAKGQRIKSFSGTWYVLNASGTPSHIVHRQAVAPPLAAATATPRAFPRSSEGATVRATKAEALRAALQLA